MSTKSGQGQTEAIHEQTKALNAVRQALVGDGETTLLTQLQKLRSDSRDQHKDEMLASRTQHDEYLAAFREFAKHMVENSSKALVEALRDVIKDFNKNLTEQFGENFKQLNASVERLVVWQAEYRKQMEEMKVAFDTSVASMTKIEAAARGTSTHAQAMTEAARSLETILQGYERSQAELERHLKEFANLSAEAQRAMPEIRSALVELVTGFKTETEAAVNTAKRLIETSTAEIVALSAKQADGIAAARAAVDDAVAKSSATIQDSFARSASALDVAQKAAEQNLRNANENLEKISSHQRDELMKHLKEFDDALGKELTKSLESLGNQLAALSAQFVKDYRPLTDRLREVVQLAERIK